MTWFNSVKSPKLKNIKKVSSNAPDGMWKKCTQCKEIIQLDKLFENKNVCPYCEHHFRLSAEERIKLLLDDNSFQVFGEELVSNNPLEFEDQKTYKVRLENAKEKTGRNDGTYSGIGTINSIPVSIAVMDFFYMGGSMGAITGEKIATVFDEALKRKIPAIVISCSGGARMQEGIISLMQMAKTSASRQKLKNAGIPYISVLTDPTTGGCAASFAMLGDVTLAEPKALVGFAGPRVIEQSIRQSLPDGFQRSEFLKKKGFVDRIVHRKDLKDEISFFAKMFHNES